jgi:hypothetical protein
MQRGWYEAVLHEAPPAPEPAATCERCVMCQGATPVFAASTKCCTFTPKLANFLVGGALRDTQDVGLVSVRSRIAARVGVTPLGLDRSVAAQVLGRHALTQFGRAEALRCPHLVPESGACGIWDSRNAVCATWFCKHERGAVGARFWHAVRDFCGGVEQDLALWCLTRLGLEDEHVADVLRWRDSRTSDERDQRGWIPLGELDGTVPDRTYRLLWRDWVGREDEWYAACFNYVHGLVGGELVAALSADTLAKAAAMRAARRVLDRRDVPAVAVLGDVRVRSSSDGDVVIASYSDYDALVMQAGMVALLGLFDGRPTPDVVAAVERDHGLRLDETFLQRLVDHGALVDPRLR